MSDTKIILGLDLGVASAGWALTKEDNGKPVGVIKSGVRIFKGNKERAAAGSGQSQTQVRRESRSARRRYDRRARRKQKLLNILRTNGMAPIDENKQWNQLDPYSLRAKGLDEELSPQEFGRALYHICQRRGFKSNRKSGDSEDGIVKEEINNLNQAIHDVGLRTLGEFLNTLPAKERKRNRYTSREQFVNEFNQLWQVQSKYRPDKYIEELKSEIFNSIFFQRKVGSQAHLIGKCELEPGKKRAPKADLLFQQFRIEKTVNSLVFFDEDMLELEVSDEQLRELKEKLNTLPKMTFNQVKKFLRFNSNAKINLEQGADKEIKGNTTNARLQDPKAFGPDWYSFSEDDQNEIIEQILHIEKPEVMERLAKKKWGRNDEQAKYIANLQLEAGYGHFSKKALRNILPHLQKGFVEYDAIIAAGYNPHEDDDEICYQLPVPDEIRNPVVFHAMCEVRKLVNAIIRKYGVPDMIRVELARDLKAGSQERERQLTQNRKNKKENDEANEALKKAPYNLQNPTYEDRLWYKLRQECGGHCPFTGRPIEASHFHSGEVQIEHIVPFKRSLDDSFMNKTLCFADFNREKGDRTPIEAFGSDQQKFDKVLQNARRLPEPKRKKFSQQDVKVDEFIEQQLNDTRYISKEVKTFLEKLDTKVDVVKGQTTSILRRNWKLDCILHPEGKNIKNRSDHRHHAIDAVVTALTNRSILKSITHDVRAGRHNRILVPEPWSGFFDDVKKSIDEIIVSHRVHRKIRGALHEETVYGPGKQVSQTKQHLVLRRPVHQISKEKDLQWIRDPNIREIVTAKLEDKKAEGLSPKDAIASLEHDPPILPDKNGSRPIRKVRMLYEKNPVNFVALESNGKPKKLAVYGSNHHAAIYRYKDSKTGEIKQKGEIVPMLEAKQRAVDNEPIILKDHPEYDEFVMSLSQDEMIRNKEDGKLYRLQKIETSGNLTFREHKYAYTSHDEPGYLAKSGSRLHAEKVVINPLGEVRSAGD